MIPLLLASIALVAPSQAFFRFLTELDVSASGTGLSGASKCAAMTGLTPRQRALCERQPELMSAVASGVAEAVKACQFAFAGERWNCSTHPQAASAILSTGSRETAFMHAMSSAGVVAAVARACAEGTHSACSCAPTRAGTEKGPDGKVFAWGGCGDNVKYGAAFARKFLDKRERSLGDRLSPMHLHNNRVGRKVVKRMVGLSCKCHGVSGSCTTRTCWRTAPPLNAVATLLHDKYQTATQVKIEGGKELVPAVASEVRYRDADSSSHPKSARRNHKSRVRGIELVFVEPSPDYCVADIERGSLGTGGRECNRTSTGPDSCDLLCCGRGYTTTHKVVTTQCECAFVWCCEVVCKECRQVVEVNRCRGGEGGGGSLGRLAYQTSAAAAGAFARFPF